MLDDLFNLLTNLNNKKCQIPPINQINRIITNFIITNFRGKKCVYPTLIPTNKCRGTTLIHGKKCSNKNKQPR